MTEDDERDVQTALHCAETGNATHWPTAAGILADEVKRLRGLSADPATIERVAKALHADQNERMENRGWHSEAWEDLDTFEVRLYRRRARSAVRALQGEAS
ncbi:hypothetical protein [Amycolatopsis palatopharyngis]|uniref:hypothetical protein n=1 Tax=Amycolatopsis palatopharyngis TaxID=187982 RepID=UPI000E247342|nr:hypothetical protein [Amycolatopsis palatopharyngis]